MWIEKKDNEEVIVVSYRDYVCLCVCSGKKSFTGKLKLTYSVLFLRETVVKDEPN